MKTGTFFPPERKIVKKPDFAEDESSQISRIETVETAGDVEVIETFETSVFIVTFELIEEFIETFEAIEAAGDIEVKEAEGK